MITIPAVASPPLCDVRSHNFMQIFSNSPLGRRVVQTRDINKRIQKIFSAQYTMCFKNVAICKVIIKIKLIIITKQTIKVRAEPLNDLLAQAVKASKVHNYLSQLFILNGKDISVILSISFPHRLYVLRNKQNRANKCWPLKNRLKEN